MSQIIYSFMKCGCSIYFFLNFPNLLCRGTDFSKYFRESLRDGDNESRLHLNFSYFSTKTYVVGTHYKHLGEMLK